MSRSSTREGGAIHCGTSRRPTFGRDTRGTTIVEYGIMLFFILVIGALAVKVLGVTLERRVGQANKHMSGQGQASSEQTADNAPASTAAAATGGGAAAAGKAKVSGGISNDPTAAGGVSGAKEEEQESGVPLIARFALIALGVIGAAAAFFAMSKGNKPAG